MRSIREPTAALIRRRQAARAARGVGQPGYGKPSPRGTAKPIRRRPVQAHDIHGKPLRNQPGYEGKQTPKPTKRLKPRRAPGGMRTERLPVRNLPGRKRPVGKLPVRKLPLPVRADKLKQATRSNTYKPKAPQQSTQYITGKTTGKPVQARRRTTY